MRIPAIKRKLPGPVLFWNLDKIFIKGCLPFCLQNICRRFIFGVINSRGRPLLVGRVEALVELESGTSLLQSLPMQKPLLLTGDVFVDGVGLKKHVDFVLGLLGSGRRVRLAGRAFFLSFRVGGAPGAILLFVDSEAGSRALGDQGLALVVQGAQHRHSHLFVAPVAHCSLAHQVYHVLLGALHVFRR